MAAYPSIYAALRVDERFVEEFSRRLAQCEPGRRFPWEEAARAARAPRTVVRRQEREAEEAARIAEEIALAEEAARAAEVRDPIGAPWNMGRQEGR